MQAEQDERREADGNDSAEENALDSGSSEDEEDEGDAEAGTAQHSKHSAAALMAAGADPLQKGFRSVTAQLLMKYGGTPSKQSLHELKEEELQNLQEHSESEEVDESSEDDGGSSMDDDPDEEGLDVEEDASKEEEASIHGSASGESEGERGENGAGVRQLSGRRGEGTTAAAVVGVGDRSKHAGAEEEDDFGLVLSDAEGGSDSDEGEGEGAEVQEGAGSEADADAEDADEDEDDLAAAEVGEEEAEEILRQIEEYTQRAVLSNGRGAVAAEEGSGEEDNQMELIMQAIAIKRGQYGKGLDGKGDHDEGDVSGDSTQDGAEDVVPYTPAVPQDAAEFSQMAKGLSAGGVEELVRRIRMYNANVLNAEGRVGLQQLCAVLLRRYTAAAAERPLPQQELQGLVGALLGLVAEVPLYAATLVRAHLKKLFEKARGALEGTEYVLTHACNLLQMHVVNLSRSRLYISCSC